MARRRDLSIEFCGVKSENPFFLSSSPVGSNYEMCKKALESGWGGIVYKTVGYWIPDECSPRFDATRKEGAPFIGFKNMEMISDKPTEKNLEMMYQLKKDFPDKVLVASIMGENEEEWAKLSKAVTEIGADIIECNFSCPQMTTASMGSDVGTNMELVEKYSKAVSSATHLPVLAKMTPNITLMEIAARAAIKGGATGIAAINTIKSITEVDLDHFTALPIVNGKSSISGYSGKAVKPIALRFIAQMASDPVLKGVPISGIGGIETWQDALEFILLGSRNIQVTTSIMQYGYRIVEDMISGMSYWMEEKGINSLEEIVGKALPNIIPADKIDRDFKVYPEYDHDQCVGCGRCYISCYDGGHQAIKWDEEKRKPSLDEEKCVGCGLCWLICPIENCITPGERKFHSFGTPRDVNVIAKKAL
ncbi:dihydroorotate oxidase B, catalytic subunit [Natronincola peptidivorans]|uniref:Dihydroorotate dehydrogenase B (NAD(+)), catalytic subunit n=1 Tax=Natronincola peptidivorans TaxID=426128 RepID=A0A1H9ZZV8_9FIRM|nr:NAD-dependent dihydropyrimidine dehydrogenase subunit PreA [Natronincola peptidivorans]SES87308.1 dihydroorotate oxidase B, catalytic subunit [Natronincola peptidivorans]